MKEELPDKLPPKDIDGTGVSGPQGIGRNRLAAAFAVAAVSDMASVFLEFIPVLQWIADGITAILLFLILGRRWAILPGLVAEAIPGVAVFPFWILVVAAVAMWGRVKPKGDGGPPDSTRGWTNRP